VDRHINHAPLNVGQYWRYGKIDPRIFGERMIVVHDKKQQKNANYTPQGRRRKRPLVDRDSKDLKDGNAN
jgi:hypothetical protein